MELIKSVDRCVGCGIFCLCLWMLLVCEESNNGVCVCVQYLTSCCVCICPRVREIVPSYYVRGRVIARMRVTPVSDVFKFLSSF